MDSIIPLSVVFEKYLFSLVISLMSENLLKLATEVERWKFVFNDTILSVLCNMPV